MEHKDKIQEFKVSIRRNQLNHKIVNLRAKCHPHQNHYQDTEAIITNIRQLFNTPDAHLLYSKVGQLKQYSQSPQIVTILKDYFEGFYRLLVEVDLHNKDKERAD